MNRALSILDSDEVDVLTRLRLLESAVINAHDAVLITQAEPIDTPGPTIQYVNPAFTRMTGYSAEEVLGKNPRLLQGPLSSLRAAARIRTALRNWQSLEIEVLNYRKNGTTFWVELSISPVCDETGWYTHWISIQRDITERKTAEESAALVRQTHRRNRELTEQIRERKLIQATLSHAAFHDSLTGLRNRIFFSDMLKTALKRVQSSRDYYSAVIFLDLDGFKAINDSLGHQAGDLVLIDIANRVKGCARVQDTVARLGGDEFTLLLDGLHSMQDAMHVVERILKAVAQPITISGVQVQLTASLGLCEVNKAYEDVEQIMRDADTGMYRAKRQGGGQWVVFEESMRDSALNALRAASEIRRALRGSEFELHYQPLVNLRDAKVYGVEALLRWNHPERGKVNPSDFISLAEEMGLINDIGRWVIQQAIADVQGLATNQRKDLLLSVNVSSKQLESETFLSELKETLDQARFSPSSLQLEITESIFLRDADRIGELLKAIRALGVKIAFDDFGTGYSSISYLERYPVDMLKIDQYFVQNLGSGQTNAEVIQIMVRLAGVFGMVVAAEGVEEDSQAAALIEAGCEIAQGYLYSSPMPLSEIKQYVSRNSS